MGILVDGVWKDEWYDTKSTGGRFVRWESRYRSWITPDGAPGPSGKGGFAAASGALSSLRVSCLSMGAPHLDHARAESAGECELGLCNALAHG